MFLENFFPRFSPPPFFGHDFRVFIKNVFFARFFDDFFPPFFARDIRVYKKKFFRASLPPFFLLPIFVLF